MTCFTQEALSGKSALVTGAGSGIGRAVAHALARSGCSVIVTDISDEHSRKVAEDIVAAGGRGISLQLDVVDTAAVQEAVDRGAREFGSLDIIVNNAGINPKSAFDDEKAPGKWARSLDVMLTAPRNIVAAALPHLRQSSAARVINIASIEGLVGTAGASAYAAAKSGVIGFTRALAVELGPENITVNAVCPGPIHTGMTAAVPEESAREYVERATALLRGGEPEEVANLVTFLSVEESSYITGAVIPVDGGMTARGI
ncbi:SDR family NAD(P)-dependent oxidoreductase [Parahaliea mediterranea]|uniref:SDR family oxidoreductase n=1 Tax=Parahaliea mediterranea TaxID=651086 RepID=A0A939DG21_9GAMM|nr:SDR family NAD(P)-dependent oxidoreductase [Parahaliea mediterranea]MBN7797511.1 SDR family oxidoreductase [Parahaliea mediterranea]